MRMTEIYAAEPNFSNRPVSVKEVVYVDNYYTCPELADKLVVEDTHCVGIVCANRKGMLPLLQHTPVPVCGQVQSF